VRSVFRRRRRKQLQYRVCNLMRFRDFAGATVPAAPDFSDGKQHFLSISRLTAGGRRPPGRRKPFPFGVSE
jgi:hypothetical protein